MAGEEVAGEGEETTGERWCLVVIVTRERHSTSATEVDSNPSTSTSADLYVAMDGVAHQKRELGQK